MARTIIIFDLDGTLVDSTDAHVESYQLAFEKNNLARKPREEILAKFGLPAEVVIKHCYPNLSKRKFEQVVKDKQAIFEKKTYRMCLSIDGVKEALEELKKKYFFAIESNTVHRELPLILKSVGISPRIFRAACGKDDAAPKPSPNAVFKIEAKIKAKAEFFVGDTIYDVQTGKNAGIKTIAVLSGIGKLDELNKEKPTYIIDSVKFLPDLLFGRL